MMSYWQSSEIVMVDLPLVNSTLNYASSEVPIQQHLDVSDLKTLLGSPQDNYSSDYLCAPHFNSNASSGAHKQHLQAVQNQPESGPSQPEANMSLMELLDIGEVAGSGAPKHQQFHADQSHLVQDSGLSQAFHRHQGRKRSRQTQGEDHATNSKPLTVQSALKMITNLKHQVDRREKELGNLRSLHSLIYKVNKIMTAKEAKSKNDDFLNLWAKRPDVKKVDEIALELDDIKDKCQEFSLKQGYNEEIPNDLAERLEKVRSELEPIMSKLTEENKEVSKLSLLIGEDKISIKALREKLQLLSPWLFNKNQASPHLDDDDDDDDDTDEVVEDFIKKLNNCNRTINRSEFVGLIDEMNTCGGWHIPKSLEPFACRVEVACKKKADTIEEMLVLIKLSATVREMEKIRQLEQVSKQSLLKWGAVINESSKIGFHLKYANMHLKRIAYAYFGSKAGEEKLKTLEMKKLELEAEHNVLKECVDAAQEFQGNICLSDGLFA